MPTRIRQRHETVKRLTETIRELRDRHADFSEPTGAALYRVICCLADVTYLLGEEVEDEKLPKMKPVMVASDTDETSGVSQGAVQNR